MGRALCHVDNAYWIPHFVAQGRIAKTNKTSQTAFRGFGGPQGMFVIEDILGRVAPLLGIDAADAAAAQPLRARPDHAVRPARAARRATARDLGRAAVDESDFDARRAAIAAFNAEHDDVKRATRDHAREVRHLVHPHRLQPGRRARARLQGRLGAREPRRHRDGPGPAHEDAAGRGHGARRCRSRRCDSRRPAPTRCRTPRPPRRRRAPTSTAAR